MSALKELRKEISSIFPNAGVVVAISKTKPADQIQSVFDEGHRDFGENKVQELCEKWEALPKDIKWHFVGHLQRNKVKYLAPFVHLIHAVDSIRLAREIDKQAKNRGRKISVLIQAHIAEEESKFGVPISNMMQFFKELDHENFENIQVRGLMGMATLSDDREKIKMEFKGLKNLFEELKKMEWKSDFSMEFLSMGMSRDYLIAIEEGSNMIRIGTKVFGERN